MTRLKDEMTFPLRKELLDPAPASCRRLTGQAQWPAQRKATSRDSKGRPAVPVHCSASLGVLAAPRNEPLNRGRKADNPCRVHNLDRDGLFGNIDGHPVEKSSDELKPSTVSLTVRYAGFEF